MRLRVPFASLCFATLFVLPVAAQFPDTFSRIDMQRGTASVTGTLYGPDGVAWSGVPIEIRDATTNAVVGTVYSQAGGGFELRNLPPGNYELAAEAQGVSGRQFVATSSPLTVVELRLNQGTLRQTGPGASTSVAMLKVPQKARDRCTKAEQAFAAKKFDDARKLVEQSLSIYPKNPRAVTLRGMLEAYEKNTPAAMQDFQSAIDFDANYEPAYTALGAVYNSEHRYDDAELTTARAVAIAPNAWQGYFEMARAYIGKGMYQKALQVASRAQSLGANSLPSVHLIKAYAMVPLKLYKDASQELQAFLSHAPEGQNTESVRQLLAQVQAAEALTATAAPVTSMGFVPAH